jgi:hypothetical protein
LRTNWWLELKAAGMADHGDEPGPFLHRDHRLGVSKTVGERDLDLNVLAGFQALDGLGGIGRGTERVEDRATWATARSLKSSDQRRRSPTSAPSIRSATTSMNWFVLVLGIGADTDLAIHVDPLPFARPAPPEWRRLYAYPLPTGRWVTRIGTLYDSGMRFTEAVSHRPTIKVTAAQDLQISSYKTGVIQFVARETQCVERP